MPSSLGRILRSWWTEDFDRDWAAEHLRSSGLLRSQRIVMGLGCLAFGLSALFSLPFMNPWMRSGMLTYTVLVAVAGSSVVLAAFWWSRPWPGVAASLGFIAYADLCVVLVMAAYRSVFDSMPGLTLLAAVSVYTVIHHGPRAVIVQTAAVLGILVAFAVWAGVQHIVPPALVAVRSLVVVPVTICIPVLLVPLVAVLRRDATGSFRDDMTDLHNRRGMQVRASELIARGADFSLLLIDIDRFKSINDEYGHAAGDAALVFVASVMRRLAPSSAVVSRIGGDEFAIVMRAEDAADEVLAQRLHDAVGVGCAVEGAAAPLTVSIGVATTSAGRHAESGLTDIDDVLLRADRAMYRAKNDGGARTVLA
ncbi:GGDEF domain-containing protein [Williamsia deligens]|uniref:Diguanylate cyclase domain-containing protein n=1 Tax=Williamsia deligens TaxID=321325 RepID=A0ABW3G3E0_9NOCA|nr:GGDEF domain-containing protein [Williamsia deligens]MCP2194493.1 diguanylate cyclase (GGDEF) domain-containing protein [Williamsia deligens]